MTGIGWRSQSRFYALPDVLGGLKVLDICAGMSDSVHYLREQGAEAYAVDTAYADLEAMYARHYASFEVTARTVFGLEPDSARGVELYRSLTAGFVAGAQGGGCVAASATALPFPDACFDLVLSFNGIFGTLDFDAGVLASALAEAVRVTKPGGSIQLVPYQHGPVLSDLERSNQATAVHALSRAGRVNLIDAIARTEAGMGAVNRLTITRLADGS